jgi:hypothetical protein
LAEIAAVPDFFDVGSEHFFLALGTVSEPSLRFVESTVPLVSAHDHVEVNGRRAP